MKSGYSIGKWKRFPLKWPYSTLPVGAYLVFENVYEGYKCAMAAHKFARSNGMKFKSKRFKTGYAVKRVG